MPDEIVSIGTAESTADRAQRICDHVERMIQTLGEHPECELKLIWKRDTPYNKAEFVKDIQAIANSAIAQGKEKYIVVGADERRRVIEAVIMPILMMRNSARF